MRAFDLQMAVIFGTVFYANEDGLSSDDRGPCQVVSLSVRRMQHDLWRFEMVDQCLLEEMSDAGVGVCARVRAVEGGGSIAFPVVDVAAAHALGVRRFQ